MGSGQDPPVGVVRAWTDGSEQKGLDGRPYAGYGVWFGHGHVLNVAEKLIGLVQTNNRAEMTAVLHVLKVVPIGADLQICTDSQLVVDAILYWIVGWERRGWKTKAGQQVENEDLWREIKAAVEERTGDTKVIKVPSHVDIEGNEMADELADKGVKKHGKKMRGEKEQEVAEVAREKRRKRQEVEETNTVEFKSTPPKKFPPEKPDMMPIGKRSRPNSAQQLINLGPLLAPLVVTVPCIRPVTYLDLHSQLTAEQVRVKMVHIEAHIRCAILVEYFESLLDLTARFERLRRWMLLVADRQCRLALRAGDQLQKAELHFREGIMGYEGMAWPHLTQHLFAVQERCHRECILRMSKAYIFKYESIFCYYVQICPEAACH